MAPSHRRQFPQRTEEVEWLDLGYGTPSEVAASLNEIARINTYLGGLRALFQHLLPRLQQCRGPVTVLDLGTGNAALPLALLRRTRARRPEVRVIAVDLAPRHLEVASRQIAATPAISLLRADAAFPPLPARSVDFVISSLFLHHFHPADVLRVLHHARRTARRGVIMSDLVRGRGPQWAFEVLRPIIARSPLTRHDGALSIRRAYVPAEIRTLARLAGLAPARVHAHWPWRMTLVADLE